MGVLHVTEGHDNGEQGTEEGKEGTGWLTLAKVIS